MQHSGRRVTPIFISNPKEPKFFSVEANYGRGWDWYEALFAASGEVRAIGEGSVNYTMRTESPHTARRIVESLPGAKFIYLVRHPVARIVSNYRQFARVQDDSRSFEEVIFTEALRPWHVDRSRYWFQISAYRELVPDDRILVLFHEDFKADPVGTLRDCYRFLGVDPGYQNAEPWRQRNVTPESIGSRSKADARIVRRLQKSSAWRSLSPITPPWVRRFAKVVLNRSAPRPVTSAVPTQRTWDYLDGELADDTATFLARYGKPADYWSFDDLARFWPT